MTSQLTEIALQMLGTIERMELIIPEITDTIRKALEEKAALAEPEPVALRELALKEQALALLQPGEPRLFNNEMQDTIRRALEALPND